MFADLGIDCDGVTEKEIGPVPLSELDAFSLRKVRADRCFFHGFSIMLRMSAKVPVLYRWRNIGTYTVLYLSEPCFSALSAVAGLFSGPLKF